MANLTIINHITWSNIGGVQADADTTVPDEHKKSATENKKRVTYGFIKEPAMKLPKGRL